LTINGCPASLGEVKDLRNKERAEAKFWGRSDRLWDQAAFLSTSDPVTAEKLAREAGEWSKAERGVIAAEVNKRVGGGPCRDIEEINNRKGWKEFDRLEQLAKKGQEYAAMDYPIVAVAAMGLGSVLTLGEGKRADQMGSHRFPEYAVEEAKEMLDGQNMNVDDDCIPDSLKQYGRSYGAGLRVHWYYSRRGERTWGGKKYFALATVLG
jgi:hypothetical protein